MLPPETLYAFGLAAFLLSLAPGPDNIFVLTQSAMTGARSGVIIVLGLCSGVLVHSAAVALGLAALVNTSVVAFTVLKFAGVAYLLYLAFKAFRAPVQAIGGDAARMSPVALYRRGLIMNITNPKVAIFFLAFFPQFMDPTAGSTGLQVAQLGMVFVVVALAVFSAIALAAGGLSQFLTRSARAQSVINRVAGFVFVGLAAKVAFSSR
ncbi:LysE family translocator [Actibacterium pelagium]|uniref:Membrane protein n=1 Tax=Actibacterium pelagium TaxID=2029103 RepID=A0A917AHI0_9RHOB|nr:LysE family translocator [Actibacterium pelagium]GGE52297.1 membrane protein [Actibacterium pelagium]